MKKPDLAYALGLPPRDAVAYLESLDIAPTRHWHDIWEGARARAFTVTGMTSLDLLADTKAVLLQAVREGWSERQFINALEPTLHARGWTGKRQKVNPKTGEVTETGLDVPARLSLIFQQNTQTAYMYGRYRTMLANAEERPWWMYVAVLDSRTRASHAALNRKVFRYDDPFWKTHYPPNGFRCRCRVWALMPEQLEEEKNISVEHGEGCMVSEEVLINPRAPESAQQYRERWGWQPKPKGVTYWTDAGFAYSAGETTFQLDRELARKLEAVQGDALYAQVVQTINNAPARHAAFALWIEEKLTSRRKTGEAAVVGLVQPEVIAAARKAGIEPARIAIMTDEKVLHADRTVHQRSGKALSVEQYKALARLFAAPEAVYWDDTHKNALYVFPDDNPDWCIVMPLNMPNKDKKSVKKHGHLDGLATAYRVQRGALTTRKDIQSIIKKPKTL